MRYSAIQRKLAKVDRALEKAIDSSETSGAVVLACMHRDNEWLTHESVRGLAVAKPERIPMRRQTVFDLASLTKPIATTTSIMLLESEGNLSIDDPVVKYLPTFSERGKQEVTLRHLLTHSSGLKPWRGFHELLIDKERKKGERLIATSAGRDFIIDRVLRSSLVHKPGEAAVYGDLNFIVLGEVIKAVSGESIEDFCSTQLFGPLGLTKTRYRACFENTSCIPVDEKSTTAATEECSWRDRVLWGEVHDPNAYAMGGVAGHAGLFAPADDVMRFGKIVLDTWHDRSDLLPREVLRKFLERQSVPKGSDWALGWDTPSAISSSSGQYFSNRSVGHLGFTGTSLWIDLENEVIVVFLSNRIHLVSKKSHYGLRPKIHDLIIEAFRS